MGSETLNLLPGWPQTLILSNSTSQVAGITAVSNWVRPAFIFVLEHINCAKGFHGDIAIYAFSLLLLSLPLITQRNSFMPIYANYAWLFTCKSSFLR
jgi:hypothetical protein